MLDLHPLNLPTPHIAGVCSAESQEQLLATAHAIKNLGLNTFRAGVWKPRTTPNSFQGVGEIALKWLNEVKLQTGMMIATEVATPHHVELCLNNNIDILWIGARTSANPFAVQEIADALKGTDIPVLVKNPINPDLDLWIGALQRLNLVGIKRLGAIHRGFSVYGQSLYRNKPQWHIPIELRRRIPQLPLLCDPSHIAGKQALVQSIAQQAMDIQFDGLMIETHISPIDALSDAQQQLTPQQLAQLLNTLYNHNHNNTTNESDTHLNQLRAEINNLDNLIIDALSKRQTITNKIGDYKSTHNLPILQIARYGDMIDRYIKIAQSNNLDPHFIKHIFELIHEESLRNQLQNRK